MPGDLEEEVLSPWTGYYTKRYPQEPTETESVQAPSKKKNQNKMASAVVFRYLKSHGDCDARSK